MKDERFCPFYSLSKRDRHTLDKTRFHKRVDGTILANIFHVPDENHIICSLHAKQRLVVRLILLLTRFTKAGVTAIVDLIRTLPVLNRFDITLKPNNTDYCFTNLKVDMLTGDQCNTIMKHHQKIIINEDDIVHQIWKDTNAILFDYMEGTSAELLKRNLNTQRTVLERCGLNLSNAYWRPMDHYCYSQD